MEAYNTEIIEKNGKTYKIDWFYDEGMDAPWDNEDGHGPVSEWTTRDKMPSEKVLCEDGRFKRFYNYGEAIKIAKNEGWDAPPYKTGTKGEQAERAVKADFKYLKEWCNNEWWYCFVVVTELRKDNDGYEYAGPRASLGGLPSDADFDEVIDELIEEELE